MTKIILLVLMWGGVLAAAHGGGTAKPALRGPELAKAMSGADEMIVYEGLPHPRNEERSFAKERADKACFTIEGETFYEKPLAVVAEDRAALERIFRGPKLVDPTLDLATKLCGGFHADYAVEWKKKDAILAMALVCLNCHELMVVQGTDVRVYDLQDEAYAELRTVLIKYRQQRPAYSANVVTETFPPVLPPPPPMKVDMKP